MDHNECYPSPGMEFQSLLGKVVIAIYSDMMGCTQDLLDPSPIRHLQLLLSDYCFLFAFFTRHSENNFSVKLFLLFKFYLDRLTVPHSRF